MRRADGQGTIEYVAVIALVAVVLLVAGASVAAPGVANAVGRAFARALCVVTGGDCRTLEPQPCTVRATTLKGGVTAKVLLLRVGRGSAIVRAERSDGTTDVTLLDTLDAGVAALVGARGRLQLGGQALGTGALAEAQLVARLGGGRTWRLRSRADADRLVHRLEVVLAARGASALPGVGPVLDLGQRLLHRGAHARLPEPDSTIVTAGAGGEATALLGPLVGGRGKLGAVVGRRRARDGSTTWLLQLGAEAGVPLAEAAGIRASGSGEVSLALTYDRTGRPRALTVGATGTLSRSAGSGTLAALAEGRQDRGRRLQVSATLDLTRGEDLALTEAVLHALAPARAGGLPGAVVALARAIADHAAVDVAAYREDRAGVGLDVAAGVGAQAGVTAELSRARSTLLGAWTRPPGGAWETRLDCVA